MSLNDLLMGSSRRHGQIPRIHCKDGFSMSVQASETHYCTPRENEGPWYRVEIGYPSDYEELIAQFAEVPDYTSTVYPYVPVYIVEQVIAKHGGLK